MQTVSMWVWRKKEEEDIPWRGVSAAGLAGASRELLMREAIRSLAKDGRADRIGIWLEQGTVPDADSHAAACLRGVVWEAQDETTPVDW